MTTKQMSGCEAVAQGAWEAGVCVVSSYPGSPVTSIVDAFAKLDGVQVTWATNEKVALEIAAGVAYSGARALSVMKHVGMNVAADALFNLAYTGVRGALVIIVGDDPGATCSQNEQDSRMLAYAANLPVLEPSDCQDALAFTRMAFDISERYDIPVIVRMTTQLCYGSQKVVVSERNEHIMEGGFAGPVEKFLLLPNFVPNRHRALINANARIAVGNEIASLYEEHWPEHRAERYPLGLICAGATFAAVREHFEGQLPILRVGCSNPLAENRILAFAERCEEIVVTEECSHFLADRVRALGIKVRSYGEMTQVGAFSVSSLASVGLQLSARQGSYVARKPFSIALVTESQAMPALSAAFETGGLTPPNRPPGFCAGCSHVGIFDVLRDRKLYVVGDIGCYTLGGAKPFGALHSNLCMAASIGVLQGYLLAQPDREADLLAVIGDSTFFHSGIPSLITAVTQKHRGTLLILDNAGTAMTGFQQTALNLSNERWRDLLMALGVTNFEVIPALDIGIINKTLDDMQQREGFKVIVLKGECVQSRPRKGPTSYRYTIIEDACTACGICAQRTNCPSFSLTESLSGAPKMQIGNECIGCGLCSQTCPENAIIPRTVKTGFTPVDKVLGRVRWHRIIEFIHSRPALRRLASRFERELF
jgi:indolepyruvate ferredoxin oxidoreductase alpha subunit